MREILAICQRDSDGAIASESMGGGWSRWTEKEEERGAEGRGTEIDIEGGRGREKKNRGGGGGPTSLADFEMSEKAGTDMMNDRLAGMRMRKSICRDVSGCCGRCDRFVVVVGY